MPPYRPIDKLIKDNTALPVDGQDGRFKLEPGDMRLQLAKATGWLFQGESEERVHTYMPKDVKKYEGRGHDWKYYENSMKQHIANMTSETVFKALPFAKMLVLEKINDTDFQAAMRGTDQEALYWFRNQIINDHTYYLFSKQWKAISYDFIHHEGVRHDAAEEVLRRKLNRFTKLCAAQLLHNWYRFGIQLSASPGKPDEPNEAGARAYVFANYIAVVGLSAFSNMIFRLGGLPAARKFTTKKQDRYDES